MKKVYAIRWLERDSWSGPEWDGVTVFNQVADREKCLSDFNKERKKEYSKNKGVTPESYTNPEETMEVFVNDDLVIPENGLRIWENEVENKIFKSL